MGTGAIASIHTLAINEIGNSKPIGVYNRSMKKGEQFAEVSLIVSTLLMKSSDKVSIRL